MINNPVLTALKGGFPNGTEWTQSNITSGIFEYVYNANGIWVACCSSSDPGLYYSTDGKTWTQSNVTVHMHTTYNANGIWVAGGKGLYYSTDGKTWTQSNVTSVDFSHVYCANGIWVACSYSGGFGLYYSIDGKTWTQSNVTVNMDLVYCANGIWVAGGKGLYYSTDGKTWTLSNVTDNERAYSICNANGIWIATLNTNAYYSTDGKTWTKSGVKLRTVHNSNGLWIGSVLNVGIYYSTDGKTWTKSNNSPNFLDQFYNANGIWVACSYSGGFGLYYSIDGKTWTQSNVTNVSGRSNAYYANGIWVAVTNNGLYYSVSWEEGGDSSGGSTTISLQEKTVTPSASEQSVTADSGYDGLSRVTVKAMPSGSLSTPTISSSGLITAQVGTSGYLASGASATKQLTTQAAKTVTPTASEQTVVNSSVYTTGAVKVAAVPSETKTITANGTYTPSSGKFFSSVTVNVPSSSGGGSSDNNCEAYRITSVSSTLNFKTTGTVKVWGYGSKRSNYTTTVYAFVGDGYYAGSSYGTPSKTSASFSINADGTLNGLPSGLQAVDLLVTIGV